MSLIQNRIWDFGFIRLLYDGWRNFQIKEDENEIKIICELAEKWSKTNEKIKEKNGLQKRWQKKTNGWSLNRKKSGSAGSQMNFPATVRGGGSISHHQRRLCYLNRWYEPNTSRSLDIWLQSVSATWDTECRWDESNLGMRLWWRCC